MIKPRGFDLSVYFIADPSVCAGRPVLDVIKQAAAGGVTMVQLRDKSGDIERAKAIRALLKPLGIPFIINDRVDVALMVEADGVHVGQGDMDPAEARRMLGPDTIIGVTAFKEEHFKKIDPAIVDYAGTGPFYSTLTKPGKEVLGPAEFEKLIRLSPVPVVGIGGITPENAGPVMAAGASGVAMMRAISETEDPEKAAANFINAIKLPLPFN
jgi:thiamine-phosphate pyrophosphorylase